MSAAQVTEAHLRLANQLVSSPPSPLVLATLIADSEARAVELLADRNYEVCAERDQLRTECNNLRAKSCQCAYDEACAHVLRAERAEDELLAVKMELDQVACARTDGILNESDLQCKLNMEREKSERAEALHLDAIDEVGAQAKVMNEYRLRAERAEAELAKAKAILASIEEDGTEEHNAAVRLRHELAAERARLDWLVVSHWNSMPASRAAIDAAMKEGA